MSNSVALKATRSAKYAKHLETHLMRESSSKTEYVDSVVWISVILRVFDTQIVTTEPEYIKAS